MKILGFRITEFRGKKFSRLSAIECNKIAEGKQQRETETCIMRLKCAQRIWNA